MFGSVDGCGSSRAKRSVRLDWLQWSQTPILQVPVNPEEVPGVSEPRRYIVSLASSYRIRVG